VVQCDLAEQLKSTGIITVVGCQDVGPSTQTPVNQNVNSNKPKHSLSQKRFLSDKTDFSLCLFCISVFFQTAYILKSLMEITWEGSKTMKISAIITEPAVDSNQMLLKRELDALLSR
jgi:hypothetical protein